MMILFLFGLSKTEMGDKTAPRVPNLGYFDGLVPNTRNVGGRRGLSYVFFIHIETLTVSQSTIVKLIVTQLFYNPFFPVFSTLQLHVYLEQIFFKTHIKTLTAIFFKQHEKHTNKQRNNQLLAGKEKFGLEVWDAVDGHDLGEALLRKGAHHCDGLGPLSFRRLLTTRMHLWRISTIKESKLAKQPAMTFLHFMDFYCFCFCFFSLKFSVRKTILFTFLVKRWF